MGQLEKLEKLEHPKAGCGLVLAVGLVLVLAVPRRQSGKWGGSHPGRRHDVSSAFLPVLRAVVRDLHLKKSVFS